MFFILETRSLTSATLRVRSGQVYLEHKKIYLDIPSVFFRGDHFRFSSVFIKKSNQTEIIFF
jgi:hypothetical protein